MALESKTLDQSCRIETKGKDKWKTIIQNAVSK